MLNIFIDGLERLRVARSNRMTDEDEAIIAARDSRVQLRPNEIREVARALRRFSHCRFLVFGAGYDSELWEALNTSGITAFAEHNAEWRSAILPMLKHSEIHLVQYETRLSEWKRWLASPPRLKMPVLPDAVTAQPWDVILVDGPPGYAEYRDALGQEAPGRMQSILAASKLVTSTGYVFVHDCERPAERAFAKRYLSSGRQFVKVKGWAELRGYCYAPPPTLAARALDLSLRALARSGTSSGS